MTRTLVPLRAAAVAALGSVFSAVGVSGVALAQQFQQVTNFPGTLRWSEGIECADVDHDGDLDVFVADGEGFSTAGAARQNVLIVNKLIEVGAWTFADVSVTRLGAHTSDSKAVTTGDIDGDGWVDALYCNAFFTAPPSLYVNQGAANPGFFTFEGVARGFSASYSSGSAMVGDLDDDGDLDLIIGDAYNNSTTAGKPHLFINNGSGMFSETPAALGAANKFGHMDVQLVDVDNDLDLDFFGANKFTSAGGNHYLMLNNGSATFTDQSSLISVGSGNSYEAEAGDLDNDNDIDLFFVSLTALQEGAVRNNLVGLGSLTFTNQAALPGSVDDNEIVCFDYDVDGDYDLLVGSLGTHEYLWRNNGAFSFTDQSVQIQTLTDPTLDCTVADLNNDGRYDILTAQGEGTPSQWANKFYRNTGAVDSLPPVVVAHTNPASAPSAGPVVAHAKVRDQVLDDGVNYVSASAHYVISVSPFVVPVSITDAGFGASPTVPPGTTVTWTNNSSTARNVQFVAPPWTVDSGSIPVGGSFSYTFVEPTSYPMVSSPGALAGSVTCSGPQPAAAHTTYSGGQIYRFRFDDDHAGLGTQLCYELRFTDWAGNVTVTASRCIALTASGPASSFCAGDGSVATPCPCGNAGINGHGCANSFNPDGALLTATGTINPDSVVLFGSGMPSTSTTVYLKGDALFVGGTVFGDGVLCVGGSLIRLRAKANVNGASQYPDVGDASLSVRGGTPPGSGLTGFYQAYYRNAVAAFCPPATYNVTSGLQITW